MASSGRSPLLAYHPVTGSCFCNYADFYFPISLLQIKDLFLDFEGINYLLLKISFIGSKHRYINLKVPKIPLQIGFVIFVFIFHIPTENLAVEVWGK